MSGMSFLRRTLTRKGTTVCGAFRDIALENGMSELGQRTLSKRGVVAIIKH